MKLNSLIAAASLSLASSGCIKSCSSEKKEAEAQRKNVLAWVQGLKLEVGQTRDISAFSVMKSDRQGGWKPVIPECEIPASDSPLKIGKNCDTIKAERAGSYTVTAKAEGQEITIPVRAVNNDYIPYCPSAAK